MPITKVTRNYQITIPKEIREDMDIEIGDKFGITTTDEGITLKKFDEVSIIDECAGCWKEVPKSVSSAKYVEKIRAESEKRMKRLGL